LQAQFDQVSNLPPSSQVQRLKEQLDKASGEKQLTIQERDETLKDLEAQLNLVVAG
jgi:hypothetical protein